MNERLVKMDGQGTNAGRRMGFVGVVGGFGGRARIGGGGRVCANGGAAVASMVGVFPFSRFWFAAERRRGGRRIEEGEKADWGLDF